MHTRTAYKLIPVPPVERREGERERRAQGKTEERGRRGKRKTGEGEKETRRGRERSRKKNWPAGLITSPGPGLTLVYRGLSGPRISPRCQRRPRRGQRRRRRGGDSFREIFLARTATYEKRIYVEEPCLGSAGSSAER